MTTTTPKLNAIHFMMLDVHEPLSSEEINSINPQAAVDKSAGVAATTKLVATRTQGGRRRVATSASPPCRAPITPTLPRSTS